MPDTPTAYYGFPIPAANDPADAPHDFRALAQKIEDTLHDGYTIPNGGLYIGTPTTPQSRVSLTLESLLSGADFIEGHYQGASWNAPTQDTSGFGSVWVLIKNGAEVNRLVLAQDGAVYTRTVANLYRPFPYAMATGSAALAITAAASATVAISHPSGRFTQSPICTAGFVSNGNYYTWIVSGSTTSCTVGARHFDNAVATYTGTMWLQAIQMTPTASVGLRASADDSSTHLATCQTDGCMNAGESLGVLLVDENTAVVCGPCGQPIEDVVEA